MHFFDKLSAPFITLSRQSLESFIRLETVDDSVTVVAEDGSLVTYIRVDGSRQMIGPEEYQYLIETSTVKIGSRFDRPGHALQIYFARNPERIHLEMDPLVKPSQNTAAAIGLEMEDLFEERRRHLAKYLNWEDMFFVLWTRPNILSKAELDRAVKAQQAKEWVPAANAQHPFAAMEALRNRHKSYVNGIVSALDELGIRGSVLEVHEALREVRNNLFPNKANKDWKPCLPGDKIPVRAPDNKVDHSEVLWPPLREQIATERSRIISDEVIQIGSTLWGSVDITLAPMEPSPFSQLLNRLHDANVPFRISFLIESGGAQGSQTKQFIANILAFTNMANKTIKNSLEALNELARSEPVVRLRVSLATWADEDQPDLLDDRLSLLSQSVESWGYCQVSQIAGDPMEGVMSSAMGVACASTAPPAIAPLMEVMRLIPWQRPSSPFEQGALLLRTPDGKVWPYQTGTSLTTTWFDLIFAQPGAGKSVLMNALNLSTCLTPGLSALPYVAIIDIGPSSSGLISLIKEALPPERQHQAAYYRLQMSHEYAVNPFDTQLGCREPMLDERAYLVELMTLLCTPPGQDKPYDGIQQLAGLVVDEMYRWRNDTAANAEPRPYLPRMDSKIDEGLRKFNIHLPEDPYWWDVVDKFFDLEQYELASIAQRHSVPTLGDSITAARRPQIRSLLEETQVAGSAESLINAFERMITSAIREFPILSSYTQFEISGARVCALDLMDVAPQGDQAADRQTSIMYMLARHALVRHWWMSEDLIKQIPDKYKPYHEARLRDIAEAPKRLSYDEFHRTSSSPSVRAQIVRDVREGRKRGVQIVLASQLLDDFDSDMVDLATGVWVLGTAISDRAVDATQERFGLSNTARNVIRYRLTGPRSSGAPALFLLGSKEGRYEQFLINTLGPIELWALSTSSEDVAIRSRLYSKLGAKQSRHLLARAFPAGSARSEIKRRINMRAEKGESDTAMTSYIIEEIVEELLQADIAERDLTKV